MDKKNYELDNPKQIMDADQLIEYYFKLSQDRPLIQYMEDPLFSGDHKGWLKLLVSNFFYIKKARFKNTNVKIGSRKVITTVEQATANCIKVSLDTAPGIVSIFIN